MCPLLSYCRNGGSVPFYNLSAVCAVLFAGWQGRELLHRGACAVLHEHALLVPVEWLEVGVILHLIAFHHQSVDALGIDERMVEGLEHVVLDANSVGRTAMEIGLGGF